MCVRVAYVHTMPHLRFLLLLLLLLLQVMGAFETFVGPWFLRLGNVNMSQAILELCGVPQDATSTVSQLWLFVCLTVSLAVSLAVCLPTCARCCACLVWRRK